MMSGGLSFATSVSAAVAGPSNHARGEWRLMRWIAPRGSILCSLCGFRVGPNGRRRLAELPVRVDPKEENLVPAVIADQQGIIDIPVAIIGVLDGGADRQGIAPLVLRADGVADLPIDRQVRRPIVRIDRRRVIGYSGLQQPAVNGRVMNAAAEMPGQVSSQFRGIVAEPLAVEMSCSSSVLQSSQPNVPSSANCSLNSW